MRKLVQVLQKLKQKRLAKAKGAALMAEGPEDIYRDIHKHFYRDEFELNRVTSHATLYHSNPRNDFF